MMDPTLLMAAIISAATMLGTKVAEGLAGEAGKALWQKAREVLGFKKDPPADSLQKDIVEAVTNQTDIVPALLALLQSQPQTPWGQMVAHINAEQVNFAQQMNIQYIRNYFAGGTEQAITATTFHQLPSDIADFTGREKEIAQLEKLVVEAAVERKGAVLTSLQGLGGVGKTALAVHVAHKIKDRFPDAQLFINLRGAGTDGQGREILGDPMTPEEALAGLIRPFHPDAKLPDDLRSLSAIFHSDLKGKRVLVLLDNAKDAEQVTAICPGAELPDCAVLITSRQLITLPGLDSVNLDVLPEDQAVRLLQTICDRIDGDQAKTIAKLCGYLPLALRLAASTLKASINIPVDEYISQLEDEGKRLGALDYAHQSVAAVLNLSVKELDEETKPRWAMLSVFPATFEIEGVAAVWELSVENARTILGNLLQRNLIVYDEKTQRYRLHDLLRLLAREHIEDDVAYRATHCHAKHYKGLLAVCDDLFLRGGENTLAGLGIFDLERENIEAGQTCAASHADTDKEAAALCNDYPDAGVYILLLRLHPREHINWLESALRATQTLEDRGSEGRHLGNLGLAWAALGEPRRAIECHGKALIISREIGHKHGEAQDLGNLGLAWAAVGEPRRAIEFYEQVLDIMREIGDRRGEGSSLGNLGTAHSALGEPQRAIEFYEQVLDIMYEIGDRRGEGNSLNNLGLSWAALGEPRRAIEFYEKSLVIKREIGDRHGEGNALGNLGLAWAALGEFRRAIEFWERQLAITHEIGDRRGEAIACWNMGGEYLKLGELERAVTLVQLLVDYEREIGHPDAEKRAAQVDELRQKLKDQSK